MVKCSKEAIYKLATSVFYGREKMEPFIHLNINVSFLKTLYIGVVFRENAL